MATRLYNWFYRFDPIGAALEKALERVLVKPLFHVLDKGIDAVFFVLMCVVTFGPVLLAAAALFWLLFRLSPQIQELAVLAAILAGFWSLKNWAQKRFGGPKL